MCGGFVKYVWSVALFLLLGGQISFGQTKDWVNYRDRIDQYPSSIYFAGYASQYVGKNDDLELIKSKIIAQAKSWLSENVRITIESNIVNTMQNVNSVSLEDFRKVSKSYSSIQLTGVQTDYFINDKKDEISGFVWIKKSEVRTYYTQLLVFAVQKLANQRDLGIDQSKVNMAEALKTFYSANVLFNSAEEAQAILMACGETDPKILLTNEIQQLKLEFSSQTEILKRSKFQSMEELTAFLAASLRMQLDTLEEMAFENITYRDSEATSEFSFRFATLFQNDMTKEGYKLSDNANYLLKGTYWEEGSEDLLIALSLYQLDANQNPSMIAGSQGWITLSELTKSGVQLKPSNYFQVVEKQKLFAQDEIINGGAQLEIWTNHGDDGLLFKQNDKLRISIRMNKTGYVRLINYWADGTQTLLVDNYYIDYKKVNRLIQLPYEWLVTCPCGVEFIQGNAQNIEFLPLETTKKNNITYILNSVDEIIDFNRNSGKNVLSSGGFAVEQRIVMTTID